MGHNKLSTNYVPELECLTIGGCIRRGGVFLFLWGPTTLKIYYHLRILDYNKSQWRSTALRMKSLRLAYCIDCWEERMMNAREEACVVRSGT